MKRRKIEYAVDEDTGLTWSRVGGEVAMPVMTQELMDSRLGRYPQYELKKVRTFQVRILKEHLTYTDQLPVSIKNYHRQFWGMRKLTNKENA